MDVKSQIKDYIGKDRLDKAIDLLKKHFKEDERLYNQIIQYETQIRHAEQSYSASTITFDEYSRQLARVQKGLLDTSNDIESFAIVSPYKKFIVPVSLTVFALATFFYTNQLNQNKVTTSNAITVSTQTPSLSPEKKQTIDAIMKNISKQVTSICDLIDANKDKVYNPKEGSPCKQKCLSLTRDLETMRTKLPYSHQLNVEIIDNLKAVVGSINALYKEPTVTSQDWDGVKSAMYDNLRALETLVDKLK